MKKYTSKELWGISRENYHKNGYISYVIFFFSMLLVGGFIAINLVLPYFFYLLVPFIIIPIFFACQASSILLRDAEQLTLGGFFKCFFGYFGEHFRSTFKVIRSLLISLAFYGGILITSLIVVFTTFYVTNYCYFTDFVNSINLLQLTSMDEINALIEKYSLAINMFGVFTTYPASTVFAFVFIYLCSKNSVSLFYRLNNYKITGIYISKIHSLVMKNNKKTFLKYYWSLNWPLIVFFIGGFALGSYVGYLYQFNATSLYTFGLIIAIFIAYFFYGPTYLANKEAIYIALKDEYEVEANTLAVEIANSMEEFLKKMKELQGEEEPEDNDENSEDEE